MCGAHNSKFIIQNSKFLRVVPGRLELPTSTLSVWRSNQLSYRTGRKCLRFETPCLSRYRSAKVILFSDMERVIQLLLSLFIYFK